MLDHEPHTCNFLRGADEAKFNYRKQSLYKQTYQTREGDTMTFAAIILKVATLHYTSKVLGSGYPRQAQINSTKMRGFEYGMGKRISSN